MAIDRGPWNALVDDDGSNLVGTVWNKAAIKTVILDPVDAAFGIWADVPFSAANFAGLAPMVWTVGAPAVLVNRYALVGHILYWSFYLSWFSGSNVLSGSPSAQLKMTIPAARTAYGTQRQMIDTAAGVAGVAAAAGLMGEFSGTTLTISKSAGGNFALSDVPGMITTVMCEVT